MSKPLISDYVDGLTKHRANLFNAVIVTGYFQILENAHFRGFGQTHISGENQL